MQALKNIGLSMLLAIIVLLILFFTYMTFFKTAKVNRSGTVTAGKNQVGESESEAGESKERAVKTHQNATNDRIRELVKETDTFLETLAKLPKAGDGVLDCSSIPEEKLRALLEKYLHLLFKWYDIPRTIRVNDDKVDNSALHNLQVKLAKMVKLFSDPICQRQELI